jgi:hypothetical protein
VPAGPDPRRPALGEQQAVDGAIHDAAARLLEVAAVHRRLAERGDGVPEGHLRAARAAEERARRDGVLATEDPGPS